jgi:hypothetical protein
MRRIAPAAALLALTAVALPGATHYITVAGLGGEPEYEARFSGWAKEIDKLVQSTPEAHVETLHGEAAKKTALRAALERVARDARPDDAVVVMLIGHGTFDGSEYKLNLPGPDITATELAALMDKIPAKRQLVVNMTSASGASLPVLSTKNRVVISATKTGTEKNATIFARYWVEALRNPDADTDKNEVVTALEAYRFANKKTAEYYETQKRLVTEHALLEDKGGAEGVREPSPQNGQGLLAANFPVMRFGAAQEAAKDPAKRQLLEKKEQLEQEIDKLKYEKAAMPTETYRKRLSAMLLELAQTQAELDK